MVYCWRLAGAKGSLWCPKRWPLHFQGKKLRYAGFLVSSEGAELCEERAEKLWSYPEPTNRKELAV